MQIADEKLVENFRAGDKAALDILLTRFKSLVKFKAKAYYVVGGDPEDLIQEGMIGLYKAVLDFDVAKNGNFAAFAALCIVRQVQTAIKTATRQKHMPLNESLSLDNVASGNDSQTEEETYLAKLPAGRASDPETLLLGREALRDTQDFIKNNLSELEQNVLLQHTCGKTHAEIAESIGKNTKTIDNALRRIRKKLTALSK
ncbi:MAG: sigma-70 family RNA polymerase sigma factor [Defluviitaleaceae bacterium]|nr:sigma-70 family RNA polymerase sigma factor [Defluviitaleaceae bacterium]MCL2263577.1 sigma-70 family RNA polymerase sigma factor [Defluviitaleaceae bacterium]